MNFQKENKSSLREIYERTFDDLFHYAKAITNSPDLAKDAVSDVFFYLINTKIDLNHVKNVEAYLYTSVKNASLKILSRNPVVLENIQEDKDFQIAEELNPHSILVGKELKSFMEETVKELPPHTQMVFNMVRIQRMKYNEVAKELDISVNTVRNHLVAATRVLRQKLINRYEESVFRMADRLGAGLIIFILSIL